MAGKIFSKPMTTPPDNWQIKSQSEMTPEERAKFREMMKNLPQKTDTTKTSTPTKDGILTPSKSHDAGKKSFDFTA